MSRLWHGRTYIHVKVEQYSAEAESTIQICNKILTFLSYAIYACMYQLKENLKKDKYIIDMQIFVFWKTSEDF